VKNPTNFDGFRWKGRAKLFLALLYLELPCGFNADCYFKRLVRFLLTFSLLFPIRPFFQSSLKVFSNKSQILRFKVALQ